MKRIVLLFFVFLLPFTVFAKDTCDSSNIKIQSISLENTRGNVEEVNDANINGQKINLGLKMNVIGDSAEYKIVLKNESNEDYYFDEKTIHLNSDYVSYEVSYEDESSIIKGGDKKVIFLRVSYQEKVPATNLNNGIYSDTQILKLSLINDNALDNPLTGRYLGFIMLICMIVGFILLFKDKKNSSYLFLIVGLILPFTVNALCKHSMEIETNLSIDTKEAIFLSGKEVNVKMKELAGDDTSISSNPYDLNDELITSIKYSDVEPSESDKEGKNIVSTTNSPYPIYMWYDNGTIYWWSEDKTPSLNEDASYMFNQLLNLNDIIGLKKFDSSAVKNFYYFFWTCDLSSLSNLLNWNVSNATDMTGLFGRNSNLNSLYGIQYWDVSNVTSMLALFAYCNSLEDIDALENWDVSKVTTMTIMFREAGLISLKALENWNVSNVQLMSGTFIQCTSIESLNGLENWDVSSVKYTQSMFGRCSSLASLTPLANWDVSSVENMNAMFSYCSALINLEGLESWNTASSTNMSNLFSNSVNIQDASAINDWSIENVTNFSTIFYKVPVHPEFSRVPGTWNSDGTFVPST